MFTHITLKRFRVMVKKDKAQKIVINKHLNNFKNRRRKRNSNPEDYPSSHLISTKFLKTFKEKIKK